MSRKLPSLNAIRVFEAAARHRSFKKAADELHVTHAAVSQHIRQLEDWFGAPLFHRLTRAVDLVDVAEPYLEFLTRAFDDLEIQTNNLKEILGGKSLRLQVDPQFAMLWLVPRLSQFYLMHPDIELTIIMKEGGFDARRDPADVAVVFNYPGTPVADKDDNSVVLVSVKAFPVCSPSFADKRSVRGPGDLLNLTLLHDEDRDWWRSWFQAAGLDVAEHLPGPLHSQSGLALLAAESGQGIALLDDLESMDAIRAGRLIRVSDVSIPGGEYVLVRSASRKDSDAANAIESWLRAIIDAEVADLGRSA